MTFITKQSVAFNILNNIQEDSTADYIEKSKPAMVGEIREWKGGKFRKTANGWEPVKEGGEGKSEEKKEDNDVKEKESKKKSEFDKVANMSVSDYLYALQKLGYGYESQIALTSLIKNSTEKPWPAKKPLYIDGNSLVFVDKTVVSDIFSPKTKMKDLLDAVNKYMEEN